MRSEDTDTPNIDSSDIVLNLGKLYLSAAGELHINSPAVIASSATNGQVLTLVDAATGLVEFQNAGAGSNWTLAGNAGTNPSTNFIGTTDSQDFVVKANSTELARFGTGSSVVIGPSNILGNTLNNFVLGASNTIDSSSYANYSVSIGSNNTNKAGRSITIGNRLTGNSAYEVALGSWNTTYTPGSVSSTTWIDTDRLFTVSNGYLTQSDAFTILKNGQTGVGIDNFEANTNGNIFQVGDGSTTVVGYVDSGTGNWVAVSDARTKENVQDINYGLEQVMALHPVQYDFIRNKEHAIGFIAQEVMPIIPDVVFGDEKQYGIAYQALVPVTVKAIQELNLKVTDIEKLETLAGQNSFVQNLIAWFASASNGITRIFTDRLDTKQLCVEDVCVDRAQFLRMVEESSQVTGGQSPNPEPTPTPTTGDTTEGNSGDTAPTDTNSGNSDSPAPEQPADPAPETPAL